LATAAEPRPAELPLPGGREGATVRLTPLLTGWLHAPPGMLLRADGRLATLKLLGIRVPRERWVRIPIPAFLVEHPGAGALLVDTGWHPSVAVDRRQNLGRLGAFVFRGAEMEPSQAVSAQLRARGLSTTDVKTVLISHLHSAHASAVSEFADATFVVTAQEWEAATAPRAWGEGYHRKQFDHGFDYRLVDLDSSDASSHATFGRGFDVFGDGSVRLVATPGHTPGHVSVVLRLRERTALLCADAAYTGHVLRTGQLPGQFSDEHLFRRSLREIQLYEREHPDALIVPGHDAQAWESLEPSYE
jgi:N-acyl homoserine lactone hydrolase